MGSPSCFKCKGICFNLKNCNENYIFIYIHLYNRIDKHPVPLDIAFGSARYDCAAGNVREAYHKADANMYELKKAMKEAMKNG